MARNKKTPYEQAEDAFAETHEEASEAMHEVEKNLDNAMFGEHTF